MLRKILFSVIVSAVFGFAHSASAQHSDVSPFFVSGQLLTGSLDHLGNSESPTIYAYGYDFGEEPLDPYNIADPGINQKTDGTGNLPAGAQIRYNILSSLGYWDGSGSPAFGSPGSSYLQLTMGTATRTLTGSSGAQTGSLVQSVAADGSVHKHFVSSLFDTTGTSNIPGEGGYVAPADGIYAFQMNLTLTQGSNVYTSNPFWIVYNNGLTEETHDAAIAAVVPEPSSIAMGLIPLATLLNRRRRRHA